LPAHLDFDFDLDLAMVPAIVRFLARFRWPRNDNSTGGGNAKRKLLNDRGKAGQGGFMGKTNEQASGSYAGKPQRKANRKWVSPPPLVSWQAAGSEWEIQ